MAHRIVSSWDWWDFIFFFDKKLPHLTLKSGQCPLCVCRLSGKHTASAFGFVGRCDTDVTYGGPCRIHQVLPRNERDGTPLRYPSCSLEYAADLVVLSSFQTAAPCFKQCGHIQSFKAFLYGVILCCLLSAVSPVSKCLCGVLKAPLLVSLTKIFWNGRRSSVTGFKSGFFQRKFDAGSCRICAFSWLRSPFLVLWFPCTCLAISAISCRCLSGKQLGTKIAFFSVPEQMCHDLHAWWCQISMDVLRRARLGYRLSSTHQRK